MKSTVGILFALFGVLLVCSVCTVDSQSTAIYCEHSKGRLHCPRGQILKILSANYGRRAGRSICPGSRDHVQNCGARISLYKVRRSCQNKPSCGLFASNRVFGDPCRGTYKYLQVQYRCVRRPQPSRVAVTCEHGILRIGCPHNLRIRIVHANYGRTSPYICRRHAIGNTRCRSIRSNFIVHIVCNGKRACLLHASNRVFGDPCRGTFKYLQVRYKCV